jgi:DNA-directed RNA polymerase I, II, and III subunit RPABC2
MDKEEIDIEIEESDTESESDTSDNESIIEKNKKLLDTQNNEFESDDDDDNEEDEFSEDEDDENEVTKKNDDYNEPILIDNKNKKIIERDEFSEDEDEEDDEDVEDNYLQKLDKGLQHNIISDYHPELNVHNIDEVEVASIIVRDANGTIIDPLHKTLPFVTRYEKALVLGERAKQINAGAKPFIEISDSLIDGYLIALKEFEQKKIPFIVRRPLPNGGSEYWKLRDLEILE